jgi:transposase
MKRIVERPGALDVHKASVTACVRVWRGRELEEHLAEFQTTVHGLLALRDWLEALGVKQVAMEATGVFWKPVWAVLEDRFELLLVNAGRSSRWRWFGTAPPLGCGSRTVQHGRV